MGKTRDLLKKIRDTKGTFHAKMGTIKDRNSKDLTEAEDIQKKQQEYWRRKWHPTPVLLPGEPRGQRSQVGCHLQGRTKSDTTEATQHQQQEYTELYKKCLDEPDNHDGVVTHLEPDILECEVKWVLGSITTSKASGGNGIPSELFQILKDMLLKRYTHYASKFGKLSSGHRTGKGQFSLQSQRKAMPKNVQVLHNCTHLTLAK